MSPVLTCRDLRNVPRGETVDASRMHSLVYIAGGKIGTTFQRLTLLHDSSSQILIYLLSRQEQRGESRRTRIV